MSIETRTSIYMACIAAASAAAAAVAAWLWPIAESTPPAWLILAVLVLVTLAGRFPIPLSRQADASLLVVPMFMGVLLMHPAQAIAVAAAGTLISERLLNAPTRAIAFNSSVNSLSAGVAGMVFFAISGGVEPSLTHSYMLPAALSGLALLAANLGLVDGMVTIRKGLGYWKDWRDAFTFESIQEGGLMVVGLAAAIFVSQAWWGPIIVLIPAVLAYYGFHHTVSEAAEKAKLAEELHKSLTELKEIQAQLVESAKMASIGSLATGIAHEINNPVFAISGRADLLVKGASKHLKSDKALEYVHNIQDMAQRITSITRHLMEYAQTSAEPKEVLLNESIESAMVLLSKKARNVRVVRDYQGMAVVEGVPAQLQQVFVNLISNAIEATPEWGCVTIGSYVEDGWAVGYVRDTGAGIADEVKERLFEPFVTTKDVQNRVAMGLGLYTCHRIVTALNGSITVESEQDKGTTIYVRLPLLVLEEADADCDDAEDSFPAAAM